FIHQELLSPRIQIDIGHILPGITYYIKRIKDPKTFIARHQDLGTSDFVRKRLRGFFSDKISPFRKRKNDRRINHIHKDGIHHTWKTSQCPPDENRKWVLKIILIEIRIFQVVYQYLGLIFETDQINLQSSRHQLGLVDQKLSAGIQL